MTEHPRLRAIPGGRPDRPVPSEPLWREVLGSRLRTLRHERGERLTETAARAGLSPQYLSEVERGRKEPSSEMIAALAGALHTSLADLTRQVAEELRGQQQTRISTSSSSHRATPTLHAAGLGAADLSAETSHRRGRASFSRSVSPSHVDPTVLARVA
jgi:transcriptional regulator with XRE-family HTH domain